MTGLRLDLRRPLLLLALLAVVTAAPARAQPGGAGAPHGLPESASEIADVPAGPGTLRGRVLHRSSDGAGAGLTVALFALAADGRPGVRRVESGPDGSFAFSGISNAPETVYLLGVRYGEVPFSVRTAFAPGETERTRDIEVFDTRSDNDGITVGRVELRVDRGCSGVRVGESHQLRNPGDFVRFVPPGERGAKPPIARVPLPAGASAFEAVGTTLDEGIELVDDEVRFWGPLHPGTQQLRFDYSLAPEAGSVAVTRSFPSGAEDVQVLTFGNAPQARGDALRPAPAVAVGALSYAAVASGPVAAGDAIAFTLDLADFQENRSGLELSSAKMWLELDDAALDVREQFEFVVSGDQPLRSDSDAPLLCLPLPPGAEEMRFSTEAFAMGIQPDPTGGLTLRGPIPAGRSGFAMSYLLRSGEASTRFERSFPTGLSLLSLYIADTGVLVETDRLHRRRPVRTTDRTYLHLEAFQIDPDETIALALSPLPLARPLPRVASAGFVIVAALLAGLFLTAPLRAPPAPLAEAAPVPTTTAERAAVYAAIRDLEDDFETGKISDEDHRVMRDELRRRAGELLREEQNAAAAPAATAAPAPADTCSGCGAPVLADARFCSQCGAPLAERDGGAGAA